MLRNLFRVLLPLVFPLTVGADDYMSPGVTADDLQAVLGTAEAPLIVDVRKPVEFAAAHIPGAVNIPLAELEKRRDEFHHANGVLIYCINGARTRQAEPLLYNHGNEMVYHLEGTFQRWIQGAYPIEKGGVEKTGW